MAAGKINLQKASGGITAITGVDGTGNTNLVLPESGTVSSVDTAVTDNAIARYDSTTGKLQDSGVTIDDNNKVGIGYSYGTSRLNIAGQSIGGAGAYATGIGTITINEGGLNNLNQVGGLEFKGSVYQGGYGSKISSTDDGQMLIGVRNNTASFIEAIRIKNDGTVYFNQPTGFGYGAGAGGTVTQLTSKTTAVTLNKPSGQIITHNSSLAAGSTVGFALNNSLVAFTDTVIINYEAPYSGNFPNYDIRALTGNNGVVVFFIKNTGTSTLSEAITFQFSIIKGAIA